MENTISYPTKDPLLLDKSGREDPNGSKQLSLFSNVANIIQAAISLLAFMLGAGILVLPFAFASTGWVTGTIILCASAILQMVVFYCITYLQFKFPECTSYTEMVDLSLGKVKLFFLKVLEYWKICLAGPHVSIDWRFDNVHAYKYTFIVLNLQVKTFTK